jgi:hypothetical protein
MRQDAPHFIILLSLIPNDFTRKRESAPTQWNKPTFKYLYARKKNECAVAVTCRHQLRQEVLTLQLAIKYQHFTSN